MIAMRWDNEAGSGALTFAPGGFAQDDSLGTCILISLFTDRRVSADEAEGDRRGWVGDALAAVEGDRIGSRLWLLKREMATEDTRLRAIDYAIEALAWMEREGLVNSLAVEADWLAPGMLGIAISWRGSDGLPGSMVAPLRVGVV